MEELFKSGSLVSLQCSYWDSAVKLRLKDLGFSPGALNDNIILGKKFILPREPVLKFERINTAAKGYLRDNSFDFPLGTGRFVLNRSLEKVLTRLSEYKKESETYMIEFLEHYEDHKQSMRSVFIDIATSALSQTGRRGSTEINSYWEEAQDLFPSKDEMEKRYGIKYLVYSMGVPKLDDSLSHLTEEMNEGVRSSLKKFSDSLSLGLRLDTAKRLLTFREILLLDRDRHGRKGEKWFNNKTLELIKDVLTQYGKLNLFSNCPLEKSLLELKSHLDQYETIQVFKQNQNVKEETAELVAKTATLLRNSEDIEKRKKLVWDKFFGGYHV